MIFKLVDPAKSVVGKVLVKLTHQIFDSEEWALLQDRHGPFKEWPAALKENVGNGTTRLYAQVWRRLLYIFLQWPWKLAIVGDPSCPRHVKWLVAQAVFDVDERALDRNSQKIRKKAGSPEALMNPWWQNFLFHLFNKVILSTAFVECLFAHFKQWCIRSPKPLSTALLQAKHVTSATQRANVDKRQRADDSSGRPLKRQRLMLQQGITGHEL